MTRIPTSLEGYSAFLVDDGYLGQIISGRAPKRPTTRELNTGQVRMTAAFELRESDADIERCAQLASSVWQRVRLTGAQPAAENSHQPVEWELYGDFNESGDGFEVSCLEVKLKIGNALVWDIDIVRGRVMIGGVNQWKTGDILHGR